MFEWNKYFPFQNQFSKDALKKADPKEVETYVNRVMESVFGSDYAAQFPFRDPLPKKEQHDKPEPEPKPDIDIFETADHVFIKVPINEDQLEQMRIKHTSHELWLDDFPHTGQQKKIPLPCLVKRKGTKAVYKDDLLEVMFQKQQDYNMSEVEIIR
ncbi:spore gernimation protein GerT [Bacillus sp. SKDU12]|uniref:spore gernimation protein GerT n=1 Tax=Bacillus sp. SKDU12 TaxID=1337053 RepID=UPI00138A06E3|nr:spore gernimation protein GerT [Bacillus sp. SKDU12]